MKKGTVLTALALYRMLSVFFPTHLKAWFFKAMGWASVPLEKSFAVRINIDATEGKVSKVGGKPLRSGG
jgi:hypothetical protein